MNQVVLLGRLGRDLELKTSEKGVVSTFGSIAVDGSYKDKTGTKIEKTTWVAFTLYDKQAENAVKMVGKKGNRIILIGELGSKKTEIDKYPILIFKARQWQAVDWNEKQDAVAPAQPKEEAPF